MSADGRLGVAVAMVALPGASIELASLRALVGTRGTVGHVAAPIAWGELEGPCRTAWWWPGAAAALREHRSHLVVAAFGEPDDAVGRALVLTELVAAIATRADAAGIYWGDGTLVHAPDEFARQAAQASRTELPVHLWIDLRVVPGEQGCSLFTTGLAAFGRMELEVHDAKLAPPALHQLAWNVAHHVLARGVALEPGQTLGKSEDEKIAIQHASSRWDPKRKVVLLVP